jgi:hypothetical protein
MSGLCGADTPVREKRKARLADGKARSIAAAITHVFRILGATLQEVFDESAYRRFLVRGNLRSSCRAYAMFLKENEQARSRRPRCC